MPDMQTGKFVLHYNRHAKPRKPQAVMERAKAKIEAVGGKVAMDLHYSWGFFYEAPNEIIDAENDEEFCDQVNVEKAGAEEMVNTEQIRLPTAEELANDEDKGE